MQPASSLWRQSVSPQLLCWHLSIVDSDPKQVRLSNQIAPTPSMKSSAVFLRHPAISVPIQTPPLNQQKTSVNIHQSQFMPYEISQFLSIVLCWVRIWQQKQAFSSLVYDIVYISDSQPATCLVVHKQALIYLILIKKYAKKINVWNFSNWFNFSHKNDYFLCNWLKKSLENFGE